MKYDVEIDIKPHQANKRQRGMFALNFTEILYLGQAKIYVCLGLPDLPYFLAKKCLPYSILFHFLDKDRSSQNVSPIFYHSVTLNRHIFFGGLIYMYFFMW
jgi:hypothetical protein